MGKGLDAATLGRAALAIVDEEGLAALSMRRLASRLAVDPMAAYRHVKGKDALLDVVVETVLAEVELTGLQGDAWTRLSTGTRRLFDTLVAHPNAAPLLSARQWLSPEGLRIVDWGLSELADAGVPPREAVLAMNATGLFVVAVAQAAAAADTRDPADLPLAAHPALAMALGNGAQVHDHLAFLNYWLETLRGRLLPG